ncbi:hypothetical protein F4T82_14300 [Acinetobacter lwoffii]|uniref:ABC-three component system middle component 1 n=1 Tax=Acinetobacter lwoffii TaxID=28090 RepID=UPI00129866B4|nr:ABC-three component system middle component 1 [Acinetobacter lwoffii]MRA04856.1 hypothetical protein [Acinetobacter lwoffii]
MIKIINKILSSNGYQLIDIDLSNNSNNIFLFCPDSTSKREEYFVTIQLDNQSDETAKELLEYKAEELFENIKESGKVENYFVKNCTMLICHNEELINRETIFSLEEDPYNFKKNVITYLPDELNDLEIFLKKNKITEISSLIISVIINGENGKSFLDFKSNHEVSKNYYSLIIKIALKLPFVKYNPPQKKLINLSSEIEKSFNEKNYIIYKRLMDLEVQLTEDNIIQEVEQIWVDLI